MLPNQVMVIMYISNALFEALSARRMDVIMINLQAVLYTRVKNSQSKTRIQFTYSVNCSKENKIVK